jgi:ubiquinone/menaquinone biosynthesis C-methylase UbiE
MAGLIKLHLGCGKRHIPGFVHVDQVSFPHIDHVQDIRDLSNFPDGCASLVYACQVIEYFDQYEVEAVLTEWRRVLDNEGILRLSVPNFAVISKLYQTGLKLDWFIGTLYGRIPDGRGGWVYHRMTYDAEALEKLLRKVGFGDIRHWDWRFTEHKHVDDFSQAYFPHMEKERGLLFNLNMEAIK